MYQVYIVDDAVLTRKALALTVPWDQWDCVVVGTGENGEKALEEISRLLPDIVITDIRMACMNGLELIDKCRNANLNIQFIIISGYNEFEYAQKAMKLEVLDYILKPIDDEELHQAIIKAIRRLEESSEKRRNDQENGTGDWKLRINYDEKNLNAYLRQALEYVQEKYNQDLSVRIIAGFLNISESYLAKLFKVELNLTFLEYLTRVRIRKAVELMKDKNMPIYEIAERVGYKDYRHFSTIFKKYMGVGPKEYQMKT